MSTPEDGKGSRRDEPSPEDRARGARIAGRRHALEVEQPVVADAVGVGRSQVSLWENGRAMPTGANMTRLARVLRTTPEYILTGEGPAEVRSGSAGASAVGRTDAEGTRAGDSHDATVVQRLKGEATIGAHARNPRDASYERGYKDALMDVMHRVTELGVTPPASSPERVLDGDDAIEEAEQRGRGQVKEG